MYYGPFVAEHPEVKDHSNIVKQQRTHQPSPASKTENGKEEKWKVNTENNLPSEGTTTERIVSSLVTKPAIIKGRLKCPGCP